MVREHILQVKKWFEASCEQGKLDREVRERERERERQRGKARVVRRSFLN